MAPRKRAIDIQNHHWVPELLLRNFRSADGRVFRFEKSTGRVSKVGTKKVASGPNFNELLVAGVPRSFETHYQKVEAKAGRPLKTLIQHGSLVKLDSKEKLSLAEFLAIQSFRTDAYRKGIRAGLNDTPIGDLLDLHFQSLPELTQLIVNRHWALMVCSSADEFYLGDHPVILQRSDMAKAPSSLGWDVDGVEAIMPITPKMALYLPARSTGDEILEGFWRALRAKVGVFSGVLKLPENSVKLFENAVSSGSKFYHSIRNGVPFPAEHENVINLNSLQCAWASNEIFSYSGDFDFARRVFRETPSFLEIPKVNVVRLW